MPKLFFSSKVKARLVLTGLLLLNLLAACGDNTATNQHPIGGQVPRNTVASGPTNTTAPQPTVTSAATVAPLPTNTPLPNATINTAPAIPTWDPNVPYPTATVFPTGKPAAGDIPNFGTTINVHGKVTNSEAQEKFLDAYAQAKPGQWEYVLYTTEGAPISHRFIYQGKGHQFKLLYDNTRDRFAGQDDRKIEEYTCQTLTKSANALKFGDCVDTKGEKNSGWGLPII